MKCVVEAVVIRLHDVVGEAVTNEKSIAPLYNVMLSVFGLPFEYLYLERTWKLLFFGKCVVEIRRKCPTFLASDRPPYRDYAVRPLPA